MTVGTTILPARKRAARPAARLLFLLLVAALATAGLTIAMPEPARAERAPGAVVLYEFGEGAGGVVGDSSGVAPALDLAIADGSVFEWSAGGLSLSSAVVSSGGPAPKVTEAVRASGEITVEAWVTPADVTQDGPARIVGSEGSSTARNFMLGQGMWGSFPDDVFSMRFRTSTKAAGTTPFTPAGSASASLTHVVMTRSVDGTQTIYVDGVAASVSTLSGTAANWEASFPLVLGNVADGSRPWAGTLCLVAVFDRALSDSEVGSNFAAGCEREAPGNRAPVVTAVGDQVSAVGASVSVTVEASDPDGDTLAFSAVGLPAGLAIDPDTGEISGVATEEDVASVTVSVSDGEAITTDTFTWTVHAPSSAPVANDDSYTTDEDVPLAATAVDGVLADDTDADGDPLAAELVITVDHGTVQLNADGSFLYTPSDDFNGADTFTYRVFDGTQWSNVATVTIAVVPVPDPPVAVDDEYSVVPGATLEVDAAAGVLANDTDADGDDLGAELVDDVTNGTLALAPDGSFAYSPNAGFEGVDSFTYRATDGVDTSPIATATIRVEETQLPPQITGGIGFREQVAGTGLDETHAAAAADLDGDGDIDLVGTAYLDDAVYWFENDGSNEFTKHVIDDNLRGAYPLHLADVDRDGDVDVLAIGFSADTLVWYVNDGSANFTRRDIDTDSDGGHSVVAGDLDLDGDIDLVVGTEIGDTVEWYENNGADNFVRHTIDASSNGTKDAKMADIDGDGDIDVVAGNCFGREVAWYENDGAQGFTEHLIDGAAGCAYFVTPADVDGDGDTDVLAALRDLRSIVWYEQVAPESFVRHVIDASAMGARTVIAADLDGDGDPDVLAASADDNTAAWHENLGGGRFRAHPITLGAGGAYSVFTADVDLDGALDVVVAVRDDDTVEVHYQIPVLKTSVARAGTRVIDDDLLSVTGAVYRLTEAPQRGQLRLDGSPLGLGDQFSQDDVAAGRVAYVHGGIDTFRDAFDVSVATGGPSSTARVTVDVIDPAAALALLGFDEGSGTSALDSSGSGNHGTLVNGATFASSTIDGSPHALSLDGSNDYVDLGAFDAAGSGITLSAWFNADRYPGSSRDPRLISKATGAAENDHVFMLGTTRFGADTHLRARIRVGGTTTTLVAPHGPLGIGTWHHAAVTYDGEVIRLYLDGVEVGSTLQAGPIDLAPTVPVAVGGQAVGPSSRFFDGLIDDARILQRPLNSAEVAALATSG